MTEEQRVAELLKPRYKVIADYPGCAFPVGTILHVDEKGELYGLSEGYSFTVTRIMQSEADKFRHLVKRLEWWEDRKPEEMPEYVKWNEISPFGNRNEISGTVERITDWHEHGNTLCGNVPSQKNHIRAEYFTPATLAEYLQYINSKPQP